jgi:hypothetical protein
MAAARTVSMNSTREGANTPATTRRIASCSAMVASTGRQTTTTEPGGMGSLYRRISWDNTTMHPDPSTTRPRRTSEPAVPKVSPAGQLTLPRPATHTCVRPLPRLTAIAVGRFGAPGRASMGGPAGGPLEGGWPETTVVGTNMPTSFRRVRMPRSRHHSTACEKP